jgi:hypothetical protein
MPREVHGNRGNRRAGSEVWFETHIAWAIENCSMHTYLLCSSGRLYSWRPPSCLAASPATTMYHPTLPK